MTELKPMFPKVSVNGTVIPESAIAAEAQNHRAPKGKPGLAWRAAARALVARALMLDEARQRGLAPEPMEVAPGKVETEEEALIRQLLDGEVTPDPVTEDDVKAHWQADPERFRSAPLSQASHILFAAPEGDLAARAAARKRAAAALADLAERPGDFVRLAKELSDCPSKAHGGLLGQLRPGDMVPEFEAAMAALSPGQVTPEPVETQFGLHLILLDERAEGRVLPYDTVRPHLMEAMEKAAWARAARAFALRLAAGAEVAGVTFSD